MSGGEREAVNSSFLEKMLTLSNLATPFMEKEKKNLKGEITE